MDDKQAAKERLLQAAEVIEAATMPYDGTRQVAAAIRSYLDGGAPSLEAALGLVAGRGRPPSEAKHLEIARTIYRHFHGTKNGHDQIDWEAVISAYPDREQDPKPYREIWKQYKSRVMAEALGAQWSSNAAADNSYRRTREQTLTAELQRAGEAGNARRIASLIGRLERNRPKIPAATIQDRLALRRMK